MHTQWQALLNGNITQLSTLRLGDAKSIPAIDVILADGFPAIVDRLKEGLDIQYSTGGQEGGRVVGREPSLNALSSSWLRPRAAASNTQQGCRIAHQRLALPLQR